MNIHSLVRLLESFTSSKGTHSKSSLGIQQGDLRYPWHRTLSSRLIRPGNAAMKASND
jgi:hypothetical protein